MVGEHMRFDAHFAKMLPQFGVFLLQKVMALVLGASMAIKMVLYSKKAELIKGYLPQVTDPADRVSVSSSQSHPYINPLIYNRTLNAPKRRKLALLASVKEK